MMTSLTSTESLLPDYESLPRWLLIPFIIISIIESIIGIVGNILVILIILFLAKSNIPQTSHNCFIVNLALSDFVLCLFTMPLNTYRSLNLYMTFPPAFCKLADSFPAINICVSSLTIVTISIYRYLIVCYPHKRIIGTCSTIIVMIAIWVLAIGAASPLFIYSRSSPAFQDEFLINTMVEADCSQSSDNLCKIIQTKYYKRLHVCHESWPDQEGLRLSYTIFMLFLQFILPIFIICITYYQVMVKLRERFRYRFLMKRNNIASLRHEIRRQRRNTVLLLLIVALYAISWLPFNILYILFTYINHFRPSDPTHSKPGEEFNELSKYLPLRFLICMISAISNPFLYSYFNETFKDGLTRICCLCCPNLNRRLNKFSFNQIGNSTKRMKLETTKTSIFLNENLKHNLSQSRSSHDPLIRLTTISSARASTNV
ncbi:unnamed protein product [Adineta steineri]|uniref:G-protein coupled receptors family 1 profile domain-containing protein n=1 Tax=Adineta steineri TaxID=433720 RepID=A0A818H7M7_9BILA|nr:unnamed protein product [Adineta steineri]CAF3501797.1 unnamed protein product [Adineta steineri]